MKETRDMPIRSVIRLSVRKFPIVSATIISAINVAVLLVLFALPAASFAQTDTSSTIDTPALENQAERGGFIGSGRPDAFVGVDEIYHSTTRSSGASRQQTQTTRRPAATSSPAQRNTGTMTGMTQTGSGSDQTIRSSTRPELSRVDDASSNVQATLQRSIPAMETSLARIQGLRHGQVSLYTTPTGTTAILTGSVASPQDRRTAQHLLLLEPGINRVENQLDVRR